MFQNVAVYLNNRNLQKRFNLLILTNLFFIYLINLYITEKFVVF